MKKLLVGIVIVTMSLLMFGCTEVNAEPADGFLAIDINPSIEFLLDEEGVVVSVQYNNDDACIAAADLDFVGLHYEDAIELFIEAAVNAGYIDVETTDNNVVITYGNNDGSKDGEMQQVMEQVAHKYLERNRIGGAVLSGKVVHDEYSALAEQYDISFGQVRMIQSILNTDETRTFEELAQLPMEELTTLLTEQHKENMDEFVQNRKESSMQMKNGLVEEHEAKNETFRKRVQSGEQEAPDYAAIKEEHAANMDAIRERYQNRVEEVKNVVNGKMYQSGNNDNSGLYSEENISSGIGKNNNTGASA